MKITTIGLDLAKRVFQLHWVDMEMGEICRRQVKRKELLEFFGNRAPAVVAMEACGSAHYWGRKFAVLGHEVKLIATQFARPFVKTNKIDAADAQAILEVAKRLILRYVAVNGEGQARRADGAPHARAIGGSRPTSGWCRDRAALEGVCSCWASACAEICICAITGNRMAHEYLAEERLWPVIHRC